MRLFLDTGVLGGALSPWDPYHVASRRVFQRIANGEWSAVHTSDFVLAEALDFVRFKIGRREAAEALLDVVFGTDGAPPAVISVLRCMRDGSPRRWSASAPTPTRGSRSPTAPTWP